MEGSEDVDADLGALVSHPGLAGGMEGLAGGPDGRPVAAQADDDRAAYADRGGHHGGIHAGTLRAGYRLTRLTGRPVRSPRSTSALSAGLTRTALA